MSDLFLSINNFYSIVEILFVGGFVFFERFDLVIVNESVGDVI